MANSYAQPILRTGSLDEALRAARRLLELADTSTIEVDCEAIARTPRELDGLLAQIPEADWWPYGPGRPGRSGSSRDGDRPADHLPVFLSDWCRPVHTAEVFLAAAGSAPAMVRWDLTGWPAAPEIELGPGGTRGAYVTLTAHARDLYLEEPAGVHTVFVHVAQAEADRAPWLAAQVGLRVIGGPAMAPL
ncbi:hypothetical protein ACG5V6_09665 [Streptomyces chitinivorans]|uniref:Uncharacterized protein n=1 Tax=Streptomyces chitinivorans TaxID=1257027 RepID=A0ABW7HRJ0_9ACTN|nr:hypothetical protein [Streptomyces chitinivorans]MDH2410698.1 hypothetical protein [Streptomyces chitinivorans]